MVATVSSAAPGIEQGETRSRRWDLNPRPAVYETGRADASACVGVRTRGVEPLHECAGVRRDAPSCVGSPVKPPVRIALNRNGASPSVDVPRNTILQGDVLAVLRSLPARSVQTVCTSPPYWGLRDYGLEPSVWGGGSDCQHVWGERQSAGEGYASGNRRRWQHGATRESEPERWQGETGQGAFCQHCGAVKCCLGLEPTLALYVEHMVAIFDEVRRVLRNDGTLWLNCGDCYASREVGRHDRSSSYEGEYQRATRQGDRQQRAVHTGLAPKQLVGLPWRVAFALQADGWWLRSDIVWNKPNPMPESVTDRPTRSHEYIFLLTKAEHYYYDAAAIREGRAAGTAARLAQTSLDNQQGGYKTEAYQANHPGRKQRDRRPADILRAIRDTSPDGRNKRDVWTIATEPYAGAHFATYPTALVTPCILAGSSPMACEHCGAPWERVTERAFEPQADVRDPVKLAKRSRKGMDHSNGWGATPRGIVRSATQGWRATCRCNPNTGAGRCLVLDPFMGAGTVGLVARQAGRDYLGVDLNPAYIEMAERRIASNGRMGKRQEAPEGQRTLWDGGEAGM